MRRTTLLIGVLVLGSALPTTVSARRGPEFDTDKSRYRPRRDVVIELVNDTDRVVRLTSDWRVRRAGGRVLARMTWGDSLKSVDPGERRVWRYPQDLNSCGKPQNACTDVGGHIGPGRYVVEAGIDGELLTRRFQVGRYFTLGFRESQDRFVVWVNEERPLRRMRREARAEEKTLIVSGIVRGAVRYNPDWSFSMGPSSIVLGEVFVEVCDASPRYVENHRRAWKGERWCPWSSYVKRVGR